MALLDMGLCLLTIRDIIST